MLISMEHIVSSCIFNFIWRNILSEIEGEFFGDSLNQVCGYEEDLAR